MPNTKIHLTDKRRINFLIGWFDSITEVLCALLQRDGESSVPIVDLLHAQQALGRSMLDLRGEKYSIVKLQDGTEVAYFEFCQLQVPLTDLKEVVEQEEDIFHASASNPATEHDSSELGAGNAKRRRKV